MEEFIRTSRNIAVYTDNTFWAGHCSGRRLLHPMCFHANNKDIGVAELHGIRINCLYLVGKWWRSPNKLFSSFRSSK